jgi:two-component system chemotaxis response regulator CheB
MVRALIVEDSTVTRELLRYLLEDDDIEVVGTAENGEIGAEMTQALRPDVVLMDIHMPVMNGFEATRRIMETVPTPIVMVSATIGDGEASLAFAALEAGALALLQKPPGPAHPDFEAQSRRLLRTLKAMAEVKVVRRWPKRDTGGAFQSAPPKGRRIEMIAIGVSTGGPKVLIDILSRLPATLPAPILVVQHMSAGFMDGFARWLGEKLPLPVALATDGEQARRGTVYLAPDGVQMGVASSGRIELSSAMGENGFRPSASFLMRSVAASYGRMALGIVLTGMGSDGADGLLALRRAGGLTIGQDEASSAIFGMPAEAARIGACEMILPPEKIAEVIAGLAETRNPT